VHVVATAGHVDHGKSTLVKALTGTDPDRLAEEKARGLTIDLGFAGATLPSGRGISFVDVPGHVRFLKNMLAGVGMVDACLFVVAATEGWKPQTEEHLRILDLLGISRGVIALTKVGQCDEDLVMLAHLDIEDHVGNTFLAEAPVVEVDAIDDVGLDDLRATLDELTDDLPAAADHRRPRLWIDRSFAPTGAGTVVTGTMTGGKVRVDDDLTVLPSGHGVRVRSLQSLHQARTKVGPGNRVAVNLVGVSHDQVGRGDVLVQAEQWHQTRTIDARLRVLDSVSHEVSRRGAFVAYLGSGEHPVRMRVLGDRPLLAGDEGPVRLHLPVPLPLVPGDRFILRESGRSETIGGGEVLDIDPIVAAAHARPDRSVDRVIAERGWIEVDRLALLTGEQREPDVGRWAVSPEAFEAARDAVAARIEAAGEYGLDRAGLDEHERAVLDHVAGAVVDGGRVTIGSIDHQMASHPFVQAVEAQLFTPPAPDGVDRAELAELRRQGLVEQEEGIWFSPKAFDEAARRIASMLAAQPEGVTVSEVRETLGCSRKYALPLLNRLDRTGVTRRRDDFRIAGPRLPTN
jgi:selenocysteine-specific elongation factor